MDGWMVADMLFVSKEESSRSFGRVMDGDEGDKDCTASLKNRYQVKVKAHF